VRLPLSARGEAYAALVVLALVWGYTWVVIKVATFDASPLIVAAGRNALGVTVLFAVLLILRRPLRPTPFLPTVILGLLQTTGWTLLQTFAVSLASAGKAAVLGYTMPFWVALLAWPLLGERITGARWAAFALAACGLAFVVTPLGAATLEADALAVCAGLVWAASAIWMKRLRARHDVDLLSLTTWQMLWGTIPLLALAAIVPEHVRWTTSFVASMAFLGVLGGALTWFLWMFILSRLPAGVAGIASLATPVVGVALSAIQVHEIPSTTELIGMVLILGALGVNALPPRRVEVVTREVSTASK
jgi:drug/metabolite transporter (DMT)-like permease